MRMEIQHPVNQRSNKNGARTKTEIQSHVNRRRNMRKRMKMWKASKQFR